MRNLSSLQQRGAGVSTRRLWSTLAAATAIVLGVVGLAVAPAFAAGTAPNTISASAAPGAGSAHGYYLPTATASSGDGVVITLAKSSSGCSFSDAKVTFTGSGTCVVDFNDPGDSTYAAAPQVTQSIKVYSDNEISTSAFPPAGSAGGSYAPGATATSGNNVAMTLGKYSSGCDLYYGWIEFKSAGTCIVNFNDPGDGAFAAASQVHKSVKVYPSNVIHPSTPPAAGAIHGTYTATAWATSGDKVTIYLNSESTGCSMSDAKVVTFTGNGVCAIDFDDPGNGAFAAAVQVKQSITVGSGNPKLQGAIVVASTSDAYGHPLTLTSTGGSGAGALSYVVVSAGTANCSIAGDSLTSTRAGTCVVVATKASDGTYAAATSLATTVTILPPPPRALRVSTAIWSGRAMSTSIIGSGFYGRPIVVSNLVGTSAIVMHDNGHVLVIRVIVAHGSRSGVYRFTIVFAHGQRTSLRYNLR
ncbi:MAG: hypothetical protein ACRDVC_06830 [Acidimicrobiales bacterium]